MKAHVFMKSLSEFKAHMTSPEVPNYVRRYCENLTGQRWKWFYEQMNTAMEAVNNIERLFYVLKWILKHDFDDLTYEVYLQDYADPEMHPWSLIKDGWHKVLHERYKERLEEDLYPGIPSIPVWW